MTKLHIDFETRSLVDLKEVGLDNYARHKSTEVLMLGYAFDDEPVGLWEPEEEQMPPWLRKALANPEIKLIAWNTAFERYVLKCVLGFDIPYNRWIDPMTWARALSFPGSLEKVGDLIGLTEEESKIKDGKRLISLFCSPFTMGGEETLFGISEPAFHTKHDRPQDWEKFKEYCKRDVETERNLMRLMKPFEPPEIEYRGWQLDQKINDAGMPINLRFVRKALQLADRSHSELDKILKEKTGLENPNSRAQLLPWAMEQGYPFNSLQKAEVSASIKNSVGVSDLCKEVLTIRQEAAKTSHKKFETMLAMANDDGYLRNQFLFNGAGRTGRWCLAEGTLIRVKTSLGNVMDKAIETVSVDDLLWDGKEWVKHDGVVFSGEKETIFWDGIEASPEHKVWISDSECISLAEARKLNKNLWRGKQHSYLIYRITSPSGKFYIGLTKQSLKQRWCGHIKRAKNSNYNHPFYNAIRKYGSGNFCCETLDFALNEQHAKELEMFYIAAANKNFLYNISAGGETDGAEGSAIFWKSINSDPLKREKYLQKLSSIKLENDWSDYKAISAEQAKWRKNNPKLAYRLAWRAIRIANKALNRSSHPPVDTRSLRDRLLWKHKRGVKTRENALVLWASRSKKEIKDISRKISEARKKQCALMTLEEKRKMTEKARKVRLQKYENL